MYDFECVVAMVENSKLLWGGAYASAGLGLGFIGSLLSYVSVGGTTSLSSLLGLGVTGASAGIGAVAIAIAPFIAAGVAVVALPTIVLNQTQRRQAIEVLIESVKVEAENFHTQLDLIEQSVKESLENLREIDQI